VTMTVLATEDVFINMYIVVLWLVFNVEFIIILKNSPVG